MPAGLKQPYDTRLTRAVDVNDGVYFVGRPEWLTAGLFAALQDEAAQMRPTAEKIRDQHFAEVGPTGTRLCESAELTDFVGQAASPARRSGFRNYRYYDVQNSHVAPHVDTDHFWLNVIIMLQHTFDAERRSALLLFPHGPADPVTLQLEPGEVILFDAKRVVHARTPISESGHESAVNMGIGFTPARPLTEPEFWFPAEGQTTA